MAANAPYYQHHLPGPFHADANAHASFPSADDGHVFHFAPALDQHHGVPGDPSQPSDSHLPQQPQQQQQQLLDANRNLTELIAAAKAATTAGQGAQAMTMTGSKRKRANSSPSPGAGPSEPKRARGGDGMSTAPQQQQGPSGTNSPQNESNSFPPPSALAYLCDARAAGVHSAAALFRRTSKEPSRKYTRPPMSKLFMSLQLTPENFLQLQSRAKAYMLDPAHPERQNCVGNRGKGDTDMVKLKLFNCVRDFLIDGAGEHFFGENAEKPAERDTMDAARALGEEKVTTEERPLWPRDGTKIISLVTPLLRRMVTNERQRMYAIETRKGGSRKKDESADTPGGTENRESQEITILPRPEPQAQAQGAFQPSHSVAFAPAAQQPYVQTPVSSIEIHHHHHHATTEQMPVFHSSPSPSVPQAVGREGSNMSLVVSSPKIKERTLPGSSDRTFDLRKFKIVLVKGDVKLKQHEKITGPVALAVFPWDLLCEKVMFLVQHAAKMYPELRRCPPTQPRIQEVPSGTAPAGLKGMGPETLQGLAVAATQMETQFVGAPETSVLDFPAESSEKADFRDAGSAATPAGPSMPTAASLSNQMQMPLYAPTVTPPAVSTPVPSATHPRNPISPSQTAFIASPLEQTALASPPGLGSLSSQTPNRHCPVSPIRFDPAPHPKPCEEPAMSLPPFTIKVMKSTGLTKIETNDEWEDAKQDVAYSAWADGRLSVVVEL